MKMDTFLGTVLITMHVFIKQPNGDQQIKTSHDEINNKAKTVILLVLLTLYPAAV
jgi:hypothetical protein